MIQKPGKPAEFAESYKLMSLLSVLSKLLEKLLFSRISTIMKNDGLILNHQFGFESKQATIKQIHRIVKKNKQ